MDFEACKPPPKRWTNTVAPCHRTRQRPIHFWVTGALWLQICTSFALLVSGTDGFCPRGCSCNDVNVDCVGAGLEVVPIMLNPSVVAINLASNRIQSLQESLNFYPDLVTLELSSNQLTSLGVNNFQGQAILRTLNLDSNSLNLLLDGSFLGLLLDNRLTQMPTSSFYPLTQVTSLDVSGNMFSSLPRDFLGNLPSLTLLKIERCPRLEIVCPDAFVSGWLLQELSLRQNTRLRVLPPAALAPLLALKKLDLSSCGLEALQPTQVRVGLGLSNPPRLYISIRRGSYAGAACLGRVRQPAALQLLPGVAGAGRNQPHPRPWLP
ncbi:hypothetical protein HAZT_HAZT004090 [Hyalella azteca]|uniref:LRRNT domain-containing protein n=1 Tax=Hyalella azteca TaxID=294128 RepID=A0A6A0H4A9_HYAAZ|nr:hypothetical protein HAZT_HAZT004090 [Hyalella azteca]